MWIMLALGKSIKNNIEQLKFKRSDFIIPNCQIRLLEVIGDGMCFTILYFSFPFLAPSLPIIILYFFAISRY